LPLEDACASGAHSAEIERDFDLTVGEARGITSAAALTSKVMRSCKRVS
jgi:hypothetical protein